jgi:hypothetical protein
VAYLLDANVVIQAKNLHYGLDFCPAFWDWLIRENGTGTVFSIELSIWATNRGDVFFKTRPLCCSGAFKAQCVGIGSKL